MIERILAALLVLTCSAAAGLGVFTFVYARGYSYLSSDPAACVNCHVMHDQYDGWFKSSHRFVAACNDCHTPPDIAGKYYTKALNGFNHSLAFTLGGYPDPLQITGRNRRVTERACRSCHGEIVAAIDAGAHGATGGDAGALACITCHRSVGHLEK